MCGGFACGPLPRPVFVHVVRETHDMPELTSYTGEEIECAFPDLFELLTVMMFLDPRGYQGETDDEQKPSSGSYYALSWGCIHRDTLIHWRLCTERAMALLEELAELDLDPRQRNDHRTRYGTIRRPRILRSAADTALRTSGETTRSQGVPRSQDRTPCRVGAEDFGLLPNTCTR